MYKLSHSWNRPKIFVFLLCVIKCVYLNSEEHGSICVIINSKECVIVNNNIVNINENNKKSVHWLSKNVKLRVN